MLVIDYKKPLDYQKSSDIALAACRLRSLVCAADLAGAQKSPRERSNKGDA